MKFSLVSLLVLAVAACAENVQQAELPLADNTAYGYLTKYGIPEAERLRKLEDEILANEASNSRIVGGSPAELGDYPWQAGLLIDMIGHTGRGVCGGSLIGSQRVVTAAHCWFDGQNQAWRFTVVLGSALLFTGGTRIETSVIAVHPNWIPVLVRNDIGVIYLPSPIATTNIIAPIALPTGRELDEDFTGEVAIASGFGLKVDGGGISQNQYLSHVRLAVISNTVCFLSFPVIVQPSNVCTSGAGGVGTCSGDSGGPLVVIRNNRPILIGVTSFGSAQGCEIGRPAAFARVTSFNDFLNQHL